MKDYQSLEFEYRASPDQRAAEPALHPVVVVGAGPVGLSLAVDLAQRGVRVLLLDNDHRLSTGSRAICFAKRTLEIFDRLGCCEPMMAKGVSWNVGHVYFRDEEVYRFDLLPEAGHERPAFINLQQYYVEGFLAERALALPNLEIRWKNTVTGLVQDGDAVTLTIDTPDGPYRLRAGHVAACDGSRSPLRALLGLESKGRTFRDRFLIADVRIAARAPTSGVQDAETRAWRLARVAKGEAPDTLLDSYAAEREFAADENIRHSTRATDFITPKSEISRVFRDAVLDLSRAHPFARRIVNSGRLSTATHPATSPLNTPDADAFDRRPPPRAPAAHAPPSRRHPPPRLLPAPGG